ncbi:unnamed protein product [Clonostachys byssicola]|uniref:Uncharacterized protein n=1 Tax=Clonostachys byssicola TaxID=160290 RepID=A0A9N9UXG0_9HYPO|nr:unnamed protein product [Clonostachys byssicola]
MVIQNGRVKAIYFPESVGNLENLNVEQALTRCEPSSTVLSSVICTTTDATSEEGCQKMAVGQ